MVHWEAAACRRGNGHGARDAQAACRPHPLPAGRRTALGRPPADPVALADRDAQARVHHRAAIQTNSVWRAALAISLGYFLVKQFAIYPGTKATAYVLPCLAIAYGPGDVRLLLLPHRLLALHVLRELPAEPRLALSSASSCGTATPSRGLPSCPAAISAEVTALAGAAWLPLVLAAGEASRRRGGGGRSPRRSLRQLGALRCALRAGRHSGLRRQECGGVAHRPRRVPAPLGGQLRQRAAVEALHAGQAPP